MAGTDDEQISEPSVVDQSVRDPCAMYQKPEP
jgi:hypothetical protein